MTGNLAAAIAAMGLILAAAPASAAVTFAYTSLDLDKCVAEPPRQGDELDGGVWWCEGYSGIPVRVAEGDLRFLVSYGTNAADEIAASETLPQFNTIHTTLEWRLDNGRPFATILRFFTDPGNGPRGSVLVVTKLGGPGAVCHVGYVDAVANPNANVLARQIADQQARSFACGRNQPIWGGIRGATQQ